MGKKILGYLDLAHFSHNHDRNADRSRVARCGHRLVDDFRLRTIYQRGTWWSTYLRRV